MTIDRDSEVLVDIQGGKIDLTMRMAMSILYLQRRFSD